MKIIQKIGLTIVYTVVMSGLVILLVDFDMSAYMAGDKGDLFALLVMLTPVIPYIKTERNITLVIDDAVKEHIAKVGYDPAYGARPLKRAVQTELLDALAMELIGGKYKDGDTIHAILKDNKVVFE